MRILLAQRLPWFPGLSGATKFNVHLLEALGRDHTCRMLALASHREGDGSIDELRGQIRSRGMTDPSVSAGVAVCVRRGVEFHAAPDGPSLWRLLGRQIREFDPDAVLISEDRTMLGLATALEEGGRARTIYVAQSQTTLPFGPESFACDAAKTELLRRAARILVPSNYVREYARRWAGMEADVLSIPAYGSGPFPDLGDPDRGFVTLVNPSEIKGIGIFEEMAGARPGIAFAAVATWATTSADLNRLRRLSNVTLLPPADDIADILAQTRVLVVPSLWGEAFGRVVVEAMLHGIPVLASDNGGLAEAKLGVDYLLPVRPIERYLERQDENGLPIPDVPSQDVGPWLDALDRLLGSHAHYREISAASRQASLAYVSSLDIRSVEAILENRPAFTRNPSPARGRMHSYSQTNIQLLNQLHRQGYGAADLRSVVSAYELAMVLTTGRFRASGKTFIAHLVGTASILGSLNVSAAMICAGLLHAVYSAGDFGDDRPGISDAKRQRVRSVVGETIEDYVCRYHDLHWTEETVRVVDDALDGMAAIDRDVVVIRLANELEDHLDLGILYSGDRKQVGPAGSHRFRRMIDMARRLGFPGLAEELARAEEETATTTLPPQLRPPIVRNSSFPVAPQSLQRLRDFLAGRLASREATAETKSVATRDAATPDG
ncbi:MAG: glycosyltransferase [Betaproteobacteria bacterium]